MAEDLIVLVADRNAEYLVHGALSRPEALGIRKIAYKVLSHSGHDGGARKTGAQILAAQRRGYDHALLLFDHEGCGATIGAEELERQLDDELAVTWGASGKAIVAAPEIDSW